MAWVGAEEEWAHARSENEWTATRIGCVRRFLGLGLLQKLDSDFEVVASPFWLAVELRAIHRKHALEILVVQVLLQVKTYT